MPPEYPPRAQAEAKCAEGDALSCAWVASMIRFGLDVPFTPDHVERSISYATRACDLGLVEGCTDVAVALSDGKREPLKVQTLLTESCSRGQANACVQLALMENDHLVPAALADNAFPIVEAACKAPSRPPPWTWEKHAESTCEIAGRMIEAGRGVPQDVNRARATFALGCRSIRFCSACCDLSKGVDGEACDPGAYSCRGTKEHTSSCIDRVCRADLEVGERCGGKGLPQPCKRGTFCAASEVEPTCRPKKPIGQPCQHGGECLHDFCEDHRCSQHRDYLQ